MDKLKGLASKVGGSGTGSSGETGGTNPAGTNDPAAGGAAPAGGKGDYLDQGVGMAGKQFGHNVDRQQEEKISDGIRSGYTKETGKDIPIKDQN